MQSDTPETDAKFTEWENLVGGEDILREYVEVVLLESHAKLERERDEARKILDDLDEIFHLMRPRWHQTPSMCGRYPCWIVWLPKEGTFERKTLKEAVIECAAQILPENVRCAPTGAIERRKK